MVPLAAGVPGMAEAMMVMRQPLSGPTVAQTSHGPTGLSGLRTARMGARLLLCALALTLAAMASAQDQDGRRSIGAEHLEIRYWPHHEEIALAVRDTAQHDLKQLGETLDLPIEGTVLIEIVRSHREFNERVGSKVPRWTLGISRHHRKHIVLKPLYGENMRRLVTHELTHVVLDMKMARTRGEPPRWVHEGLAQWMEGEMTAAQKDTLGRAAVEGNLLRLDQLEKAFGGKREMVDLAYAQSYTLVAFIIQKGPDGALGRFLHYLMDTGDEQLALRRAMGQALPVIEKHWMQNTRNEYLARGVPLSVELGIFGLMAVLFIIAAAIKLRHARVIRERMQEEERLEELLHGIEAPDEYDDDVSA